MAESKSDVALDKTKKDHYKLKINNVDLGEFERSDLRHIIQQIDNKI